MMSVVQLYFSGERKSVLSLNNNFVMMQSIITLYFTQHMYLQPNSFQMSRI